MASSYQDLLGAVYAAIEDDGSTSFVPAVTPFNAELIPATKQGLQFVAYFGGGAVIHNAGSSQTVHDLVVEVLADTRPSDTTAPETPQALCLSYVTAIAKILAGKNTAALAHRQGRAVYTGYELEPINEGEWTIVRVSFDVYQIAALES